MGAGGYRCWGRNHFEDALGMVGARSRPAKSPPFRAGLYYLCAGMSEANGKERGVVSRSLLEGDAHNFGNEVKVGVVAEDGEPKLNRTTGNPKVIWRNGLSLFL